MHFLVDCLNTANDDVLDRVREKLVHMEGDDHQQSEKKHHGHDAHQQQQHHHGYHKHNLHHFHHHHRRPSRSEETRDGTAFRKWKKSKAVVSRLPSTESESSDQSEAVPEIRVVKSTPANTSSGNLSEPVVDHVKCPLAAAARTSSSDPKVTHQPAGEPIGGVAEGGNSVVDQPVKQKARLKLAQILYKEARRRRQKYLEDLQNQQE